MLCNFALIPVAVVLTVAVPIMQVINVIAVLYCFVAAAFAVDVIVVFMRLARHKCSFHEQSIFIRFSF